MPRVTITGFGQVNFPDDMTPQQIEAAIGKDIEPIIQQRRTAGQEDMQRMADPTAGLSSSVKFAMGYGKAGSDIVKGLGQTVGLVNRADIEESRKLDDPLMKSGAGASGNIAGNIMALAPTAAIPGAATIRGAAAIGTGLGLAAPSASTEETIGNTLMGGALGAGGQAVAGRIARSFKGAVPAKRALANEMQDVGFAIPPSQIPGAGMTARAAEGFGGKIRTAQDISQHNQPVVNRLARETLGLAEDAPLNLDTLSGIRKEAWKAYEAVKRVGAMASDDEYTQALNRIGEKYRGAEIDFPGLGSTPIGDVIKSLKRDQFSSSGAIDAISILRDKADTAFRGGDKGLGKALRESANALEGVVERNLATIASETGPLAKPAAQMLQDYRGARQRIAQTYSVEKALNPATDNISAVALGHQLKAGKPLSGGLLTAAKMGQGFPKAVQRPEIIGSTPPISPLDIVGSSIMGAGGAIAAGAPGLLAAGIPFLRHGVRAGLLSRPVQRSIGGPGAFSGLPGVANNEQIIEQILRRSALPIGALPTME